MLRPHSNQAARRFLAWPVRGPGSWSRALLAVIALLAVFMETGCAGKDFAGPESVVVVANTAFPESLELARYYMERRGIPDENLIARWFPKEEGIDRETFERQVYSPLKSELVDKGWIDAMPFDSVNDAGRRVFVSSGHRIGYLVLMYGLPLRIEHDPQWIEERRMRELPEAFHWTRASVDGELALLVRDRAPRSGYVPNPYFGQALGEERFADRELVKVLRLDGPSPGSVRQLIDSALEAERDGLRGRVYIDSGGPYPQGNQWLEQAAASFESSDWPVTVDGPGGLFPLEARFESPAVYLGWYMSHPTGVFERDGFRFAPGAIAVHIHSYSAPTVRRPGNYWSTFLIGAGVAGTVGNVSEPYLQLTHHLDRMAEGLEAGLPWGEVVYHALPALSWQAVAFGDPLYRPMAVSLEEQVVQARKRRDILSDQVLVRRANQWRREGEEGRAIRLLEDAWLESPSLPLALELNRLESAAGASREGVRWIEETPVGDGSDPDLIGAEIEAITLLQAGGRREMALDRVEAVLEAYLPLDPELEVYLLEKALAWAEAEEQRLRVNDWSRRLDALKSREDRPSAGAPPSGD